MAEKQEKTPEQIAAEKRQEAQTMGEAISHFDLKMGMINNEMPIEEQIKTLANYHDIPSIEDIKEGATQHDSYRLDFMNSLYNQYFIDYPEMLERLGEKKTDNNLLNFHLLRFMDFLYKSKEYDKEKSAAAIKAYYDILPKYKNFLINYIINNQRWDLTINSKDAFMEYADVYNEHQKLLGNLSSHMQIASLIKDTRNLLFEKVINLKTTGIDQKTYNDVVSDVIIGKFLGLRIVLNSMAEGGVTTLGLLASLIFKEYSIKDIKSFACEVEEKLSLNEEQQKEIDETKKMLDLLLKNGIGGSSSSDSGCFSILLLMLIPASIFAYMLI